MAADEVALGRDTLEKADISVGSTIALGSSERPPVDFRVVGQAVFPSPGSPGPGTESGEPSSVADGALLTPAGREKLRAARATHLAGVRAMFLDLFSPAELDALGDAWDRVLHATGWGCCT